MIVCLLVATLNIPSEASAHAQTSATVSTAEQTVYAKYAKYPILIKIARCESGFQQYEPDGSLNYNDEGSSAVGIMQIMSSVHKEDAMRLDYDITTTEGNLGYALHLYRTQGTTPWNPSKHCWQS